VVEKKTLKVMMLVAINKRFSMEWRKRRDWPLYSLLGFAVAIDVHIFAFQG